MLETRRQFLAGSAVATVALVSPVALAESENERLKRTRDIEKYAKATGRSKTKAGCARTAVKAPLSSVEKAVTDFRHYKAMIPKFKQARVVKKNGKSTQVYLEVPILKGASKVWAIVEFAPTHGSGRRRVIRGHMVKGNVKRFDATWTIEKIDDDFTKLDLELLMVPKFFAPRSLVTKNVMGAAKSAVKGVRRNAESR